MSRSETTFDLVLNSGISTTPQRRAGGSGNNGGGQQLLASILYPLNSNGKRAAAMSESQFVDRQRKVMKMTNNKTEEHDPTKGDFAIRVQREQQQGQNIIRESLGDRPQIQNWETDTGSREIPSFIQQSQGTPMYAPDRSDAYGTNSGQYNGYNRPGGIGNNGYALLLREPGNQWDNIKDAGVDMFSQRMPNAVGCTQPDARGVNGAYDPSRSNITADGVNTVNMNGFFGTSLVQSNNSSNAPSMMKSVLQKLNLPLGAFTGTDNMEYSGQVSHPFDASEYNGMLKDMKNNPEMDCGSRGWFNSLDKHKVVRDNIKPIGLDEPMLNPSIYQRMISKLNGGPNPDTYDIVKAIEDNRGGATMQKQRKIAIETNASTRAGENVRPYEQLAQELDGHTLYQNPSINSISGYADMPSNTVLNSVEITGSSMPMSTFDTKHIENGFWANALVNRPTALEHRTQGRVTRNFIEKPGDLTAPAYHGIEDDLSNVSHDGRGKRGNPLYFETSIKPLVDTARQSADEWSMPNSSSDRPKIMTNTEKQATGIRARHRVAEMFANGGVSTGDSFMKGARPALVGSESTGPLAHGFALPYASSAIDDVIDDLAGIHDNKGGDKMPSEQGIFDMARNAWNRTVKNQQLLESLSAFGLKPIVDKLQMVENIKHKNEILQQVYAGDDDAMGRRQTDALITNVNGPTANSMTVGQYSDYMTSAADPSSMFSQVRAQKSITPMRHMQKMIPNVAMSQFAK